MLSFSDPVQYLKGVGPARGKAFQALGVFTVEDLLRHYPRTYEDRTKVLPIAGLEVGQPACFRAMVMTTPRTSRIRQGLEITKLTVADSSARLNLTFFNQRHAAGHLVCGREYVFYGTVTGDFARQEIANPAFEEADSPPVLTRRILPVYPLTAGLTNRQVVSAVGQALTQCGPPPELLPRQVLEEYRLLPMDKACRAIHQPESGEELAMARRRLAFEEFFQFSAGLALLRAGRSQRQVEPYVPVDLTPLTNRLPFRLTGAQQRAIREIQGDLMEGHPMNRLLQGDVGSGKTVVAAAAAWYAVGNRRQVALMAPTEILAEQHFRFLTKLLTSLGVRCVLLTGSMTAGEKREARQALAGGAADLAVGTHALLSDTTAFARLGLVITDEQHRFGVAQRAALGEKGDTPHLLVMSATPIPRTLALMLYGDLDVSVLDELPPGRQKIGTFLVNESYRARLNGFLRQQAQAGRQCYVVCPAVEEGESGKSAEGWAATLQTQVFPDLSVGLIHGKMKGAEKEAVMGRFARGEISILVATTVIEVGVDVPNATVMVVEDADRFGLSQLHQLRGRVGRGREKSWCILVSNSRNPETVGRLKTLCRTADGFAIAQADLEQRGPGDFLGRRQHGLPVFRTAGMAGDITVLQQAQAAATQWIESGGANQDSPLARQLGKLLAGQRETMN